MPSRSHNQETLFNEIQTLKMQEQTLVQMLSRCSHVLNKLRVEEMQLESMHREEMSKARYSAPTFQQPYPPPTLPHPYPQNPTPHTHSSLPSTSSMLMAQPSNGGAMTQTNGGIPVEAHNFEGAQSSQTDPLHNHNTTVDQFGMDNCLMEDINIQP